MTALKSAFEHPRILHIYQLKPPLEGVLRDDEYPLWVKSGHSHRKKACPLYPRKRTCAVQLGMSALGQKRTCGLMGRYRAVRTSCLECADYEVGSQAMSPKVKVEPARLVPRGGTYHDITRDDKIER
jgi:hypothetical protein